MSNTYKYIIQWWYSPRDRSGNVYNYFTIVDTKSGRSIVGKDAPVSNVRAAIFDLNGGEHRPNYWFTEVAISKRELLNFTRTIEYIGCSPDVIANAFRKAMRTRKKARLDS